MNGIQTLGSERLDVEALKKYQCPSVCASLWRQPSPCGVDTHAVGQSGHERTDCTLSVVPYVGGLQAWPIDKCSERGRGQK